MNMIDYNDWLSALDSEELLFIKKFILASGSLKEVAKQYDVSYPTIRLKLDRVIQKILIADKGVDDPYIALIRNMAIDEKIDINTAKELIEKYKATKGE